MKKLILIAFAQLVSLHAFAQAPGTLDTSFGMNGYLTTDYVGGYDSAYCVAIQPDGKILAAGSARVPFGGNADIAVSRYLSDGTLDITFGTNGKIQLEVAGAGQDEGVRAVHVLNDGKILIAGNDGGNALVMRLNNDGSIDNTFGAAGKTVFNFGIDTLSALHDMAIQNDGKIVLCGNESITGEQTNFALARLNSDGTFDTEFSIDGKTTLDVDDLDTAYTVEIDATGNILIAGASGFNIAIVKYNAAGALDTTFGNGGMIIFLPNGFGGNIRDIKLQSDGKIVVAGALLILDVNTNYDTLVARFTADGELDTTFGIGGISQLDIDNGASERFFSIEIQTDGKILAVGDLYYPTTTYYFLAMRFNPEGTLDNTFTPDGIFSESLGGNSGIAVESAIQADGKLILAGYTTVDSDFALMRVHTGMPLNINKFETGSAVLFPNPVTDFLNIKVVELSGIAYNVVDLNGKILLKNVFENSSAIDVSRLATGIYIISVPEKNIHLKFIKQ